MAQEIRNVDYESMVDKYMNEWEGCNLREFCFSEKVNIYRMLKTMKKMGVKKDPVPNGLKPLEFSESTDMGDVDDDKTCFDDGYVHNVKFTCGKDVQVVIKRCSPEVLARLLASYIKCSLHRDPSNGDICVQLEEEKRAQGDRIESMLKEVKMFIAGKGTASLRDSLSDSIVKKMQEQHARELAEQKAADDERYRKMDEEHRIREAALEC